MPNRYFRFPIDMLVLVKLARSANMPSNASIGNYIDEVLNRIENIVIFHFSV